jgi:hypothetical protein
MAEEIELLKKLLSHQQGRLSELEQLQATYGIRTPPDIGQEIAELRSEIDQLKEKLPQREDQPPVTIGASKNVALDAGGAFVRGGDVVRGDAVMGDKISVSNIGGAGVAMGRGGRAAVNAVQSGLTEQELMHLFMPLITQLSQSYPESLDKARDLQAEAARGEQASDDRLASLIADIADATPAAARTLATIFAQPVVVASAGPATRYILRRIGQR